VLVRSTPSSRGRRPCGGGRPAGRESWRDRSRAPVWGASWSAPQQVSDSPAGVSAFTAAVDVNRGGAVGVTYYDFRDDTADTATALTDYSIRDLDRRRRDMGRPSQRVTPAPFDMKKAPVARASFTGDYEGLDHGGDTFKIFFVQTHNTDTGNQPDRRLRGRRNALRVRSAYPHDRISAALGESDQLLQRIVRQVLSVS